MGREFAFLRPRPLRGRPLSIDVDGDAVPIVVRRYARSRSMRLRYDGLAGEVRITLPLHISDREALSLACEHVGWIRKERARSVSPIALTNGTVLAFEGHEHTVEWHRKWSRNPRISDGYILLGGEEDSIAPRLTKWMKGEAKKRFLGDLAYYCQKAGASVPSLSVGDARTRWGSCSTRGGIRLNWRLVMAPEAVRRSVVAHEVAHLRHMDHSRSFYAHLDSIFEGNRRAADDWLHKNGAGLRAVGAMPR